MIDIDKLLQPISEDSPCGDDLEYDPEFLKLETLSTGTPDKEMGDSVIPGEEPDWPAVRDVTLALLDRTKDLRVAIYLTRALVNTEGLSGLNEGLGLLRSFLDTYWEHVHPQLDADWDNDPTMRVNSIAVLNDASGLVREVRNARIVTDPFGRAFSFRDVQVSQGEATWTNNHSPPPTAAEIESAFAHLGSEAVEELFATMQQAADHVKYIEDSLSERVGAGNSTSLDDLRRIMGNIVTVLARHTADGGGEAFAADAGVDAGAAQSGGAPAGVGGPFRSSADVIRALEMACDFLNKNEPSSPVPLLLRRAIRLIDKDFMTIMQDLAPDGISQVRNVSGEREESYE